ncbi:hypothetical protein R83H12_03056 [Fibrobacteria bacterium R8-3-H12]
MNKAKLSLAILLIGASFAAAEDVPVVNAGGTKVSLYGRLELNAAYEDGITNGLWSAWASSNANKDAQYRTSLSAARTRLGLNLEGPSKEGEPSLKGRFEADFAGNSNYNNFNGGGTDGTSTSTSTFKYDEDTPSKSTVSTSTSTSVSSAFRIRQSWGSVTFKDLGLTLLFGQTDDVVTPLDPPAVNPSSLNGAGNIGNRRPQIRVTEAIGPVELAVAATHDRLRADDKVASSSPAVQGRLGVKLPATWAGEKANLAFGLGGLFAKDEAAAAVDTARGKRGPDTHMFGADLSMPLIDILTLTGEFFMGQNLTRYGDGSIGLNHTSSSNPKKVKEDGIKSMGWWGALGAKLPANFSVAAGLGMENLDGDVKVDANGKTDESTIIPGSRKDNMFIFGNVAYNFTSAAKLTFEYLNLATGYADKYDATKKELVKVDDGSLNRFELNFRYDFK